MFGYIKVDKANLLGKEYEAYKSVYCALCKQLGKDYSIFARLILSYDCTFYALLALSLTEARPTYCTGRCRFNPLKKCTYAQTETEALSLAAALSVSAAYFKLRDNLADSPWYKRLAYRMVHPFFARWRKKAAKRYPDIDDAVKRMMDAQLAAEKDPGCIPDQAAEPTAAMMAAVCGMIPDRITMGGQYHPASTKRILSVFGYHLGRWIYFTDAADDYHKDKKRGNFNPYLLSDTGEEELAERIEPILNHALSEALLSYGLLDPGRFDPIINNVLRISCVRIQTDIISRFNPEKSTDKEK